MSGAPKDAGPSLPDGGGAGATAHPDSGGMQADTGGIDGKDAGPEAGRGGTTETAGSAGTPGVDAGTANYATSGIIKYNMSVSEYQIANSDPALGHCSLTQYCYVHPTPSGNCFPTTEGFDTTKPDALDTDVEDAWNALTPAEQACINRGGWVACNTPASCMSGQCVWGSAVTPNAGEQ